MASIGLRAIAVDEGADAAMVERRETDRFAGEHGLHPGEGKRLRPAEGNGFRIAARSPRPPCPHLFPKVAADPVLFARARSRWCDRILSPRSGGNGMRWDRNRISITPVRALWAGRPCCHAERQLLPQLDLAL